MNYRLVIDIVIYLIVFPLLGVGVIFLRLLKEDISIKDAFRKYFYITIVTLIFCSFILLIFFLKDKENIREYGAVFSVHLSPTRVKVEIQDKRCIKITHPNGESYWLWTTYDENKALISYLKNNYVLEKKAENDTLVLYSSTDTVRIVMTNPAKYR